MLYDIPPRSVIPIEIETLQRLAEHPRIVAVKDARNDLRVRHRGARHHDARLLLRRRPGEPAVALGRGGRVRQRHRARRRRSPARNARRVRGRRARPGPRAQRRDAARVRAMGRVGGVVFAKTALRLRGLDVGETRLPLPPATDDQVAAIAGDLAAPGSRSTRRRTPAATPGHGALGTRRRPTWVPRSPTAERRDRRTVPTGRPRPPTARTDGDPPVPVTVPDRSRGRPVRPAPPPPPPARPPDPAGGVEPRGAARPARRPRCPTGGLRRGRARRHRRDRPQHDRLRVRRPAARRRLRGAVPGRGRARAST